VDVIIVYERATNRLVGVAAQVFDNGRWREPTIDELYPGVDLQKLGFIHVEDSIRYALDPDAWQFKLDQHGVPIGAERKPSLPRLHLSTDAKDTDGDNFPELVADGKNKAVITAEVRDELDRSVTGDFTVNFRTTAGTLSARQVMVRAGKAEVELISSLETVTATVSASGKGLKAAAPLTFEFMPPGSK
jgi:Invasin, domain 3